MPRWKNITFVIHQQAERTRERKNVRPSEREIARTWERETARTWDRENVRPRERETERTWEREKIERDCSCTHPLAFCCSVNIFLISFHWKGKPSNCVIFAFLINSNPACAVFYFLFAWLSCPYSPGHRPSLSDIITTPAARMSTTHIGWRQIMPTRQDSLAKRQDWTP